VQVPVPLACCFSARLAALASLKVEEEKKRLMYADVVKVKKSAANGVAKVVCLFP
jgi:hypothetical protein